MLSGDLDQLTSIVAAVEDRADVDDVELADFETSDIGSPATATLVVSFEPAAATADASETEASFEDAGSRDDATDEGPAEDHWCGRCGHGPVSKTGVKIHTGHKHDAEPIVLDHEPSDDELVVDGTDDQEETSSDETEDVDDSPERDDEVDASVEASADGGVGLPAGIDADDVAAAADDAAKLYEVTDTLDEQTDEDLSDEQVRSFLVGLDLYREVRDIRARPGGASA